MLLCVHSLLIAFDINTRLAYCHNLIGVLASSSGLSPVGYITAHGRGASEPSLRRCSQGVTAASSGTCGRCVIGLMGQHSGDIQ